MPILLFNRKPEVGRSSVLSALFALFLTLHSVRADYSTTVNPNSTWGTWDGWGTSLCWWANVFGTRNDMADLLFTTNTVTFNGQVLPGLGLNIARYNVGACTTNTINGQAIQLSTNIPVFKQMQGYWLDGSKSDPASTNWNWGKDANQLLMLKKAKLRGANILEMFSNSPLWWMCSNHNPSGATNGGNDNLQSTNYQAHATYVATVAKYAHDNWGIDFTSVEAFNEPIATWWLANGTQEGCHFAAATQAAVLGYLRSELDNRGLSSTMVAASDESYYDQATSTWNSFTAATRNQVGRVNVHGYQYGGGRRDLLYNAVAGKKLYNSEYGESDGSGLSLANNLNLDFRYLHMTGWCYWQAFDSGGWGLIQSNPGDNYIGHANQKFFVLAQYTRHIRSGMTIMDAGDPNTVAAYDPAARKLVLVTANYGTAQSITYNLTNFPYASGPIKRWLTVMGTGSQYQTYTDTTMGQRAFQAVFPTNTIQTFEIQNVDLNAPATPAGLTAAAGVQKVTLTWGASIGATNYILRRALAAGGPDAIIASQTQTNYTDSAVTGDTTYSYVVSAVNGAGESIPSAPVLATPHSSPSMAVQVQPGSGQLMLSWPAWAQNYNLYAATNLSTPIRWSVVTNALQTNGGTLSVTLPPPTSPMRFYRLTGP